MIYSDLIIIGAGPGGYRAAAYAAQQGLSVTIFENREVGGTCLNRGCIPTKALCHEADTLSVLRKAVPSATIDYNKVRERLDGTITQLRSGVETLLSQPAITLIDNQATFVDAHTVAAGEEQYHADHILIATGSRPKCPPIEGIEENDRVMDSDQLLALDHLPERLCIVGAGVIGMEFASIFSRFGCQVTVVEFLRECLPAIDSDIAKRLRKQMERQNITFHFQTTVKAIQSGTVTIERKGKTDTIEADIILIATGRQPNSDRLGLEAIDIKTERGAIVTDEHFLTSVPGIYAIGDVNGRQMLAHAATMQGIHAVNHILGRADTIRFDIMPAAVFTSPEAACVGLSEDACKEAGMDYQCHKAFHRANGRAVAMDETEGMVKLLTDAEERIIGCHAFGASSAAMIQEVTALMNSGATLRQLRDMVHIHPTLSELLQEAVL